METIEIFMSYACTHTTGGFFFFKSKTKNETDKKFAVEDLLLFVILKIVYNGFSIIICEEILFFSSFTFICERIVVIRNVWENL